MVQHHRIEELLRRIEHKIEDVTSYDDLKNRFKGGTLFKEITADPTPMDTDFDDFLDGELATSAAAEAAKEPISCSDNQGCPK
jgi:hypothetical protein